MLVSLLAALALILHVIGVFTAMHAVVHTRTPQGAMAWALGLVLLPYVTLIPYLYLGASRFLGYEPIPSTTPRTLPPGSTDPACARYAAIAAMLGSAFRRGHRLRLLIDGEATFEALFTAMAGAQHELLVQFFIIHDDRIGRRLQKVLLERAAAGVQVCVLYDSIGSHDLPQHYVEILRAGGVAIHPFATRRWRNRLQLNFRNHRKIVVVDGACAFLGGLNVGDEYLGEKPPLSPWRDTFLEIQGPAVGDLQQRFASDWHWITGAMPPMRPSVPTDGTASVLVVASGPADAQETGSLFFTAAIHAARERVWLSTPYFVPDAAVMAAMQLAVLRGVDVRVLIPSRPDHQGVFLASSLHAHDAMRAGIRIFRYQPGFLHQKAMLIDGDTAMIGSSNLDTRSFRLNFEASALVVDTAFAAAVEAMLRDDFGQALEIDQNEYRQSPYFRRVAMHVARLFDPIL
jgi:cardiolipin synthase